MKCVICKENDARKGRNICFMQVCNDKALDKASDKICELENDLSQAHSTIGEMEEELRCRTQERIGLENHNEGLKKQIELRDIDLNTTYDIIDKQSSQIVTLIVVAIIQAIFLAAFIIYHAMS